MILADPRLCCATIYYNNGGVKARMGFLEWSTLNNTFLCGSYCLRGMTLFANGEYRFTCRQGLVAGQVLLQKRNVLSSHRSMYKAKRSYER